MAGRPAPRPGRAAARRAGGARWVRADPGTGPTWAAPGAAWAVKPGRPDDGTTATPARRPDDAAPRRPATVAARRSTAAAARRSTAAAARRSTAATAR